MVDFKLSRDQQMYRDTAREFATRELRPAADAIRRRNPQTHAPWDLFRDVFGQAADLGFTKLLIPETYGGLGGSCLDNVVIMEEFGAADLGLAASFLNVSMTSPIIIINGADEAQRRQWLGEICESRDFVLASASSEPDVAGADAFCPIPDPRIGLKTQARSDGDDYVLNGSKAGFSTNAGAAKAYFVMARTDLTQPAMASTSMFLVPADSEGLTVGRKTEMIGWKTAQHAPVYLDDVRIPRFNRIGAEGANAALFFQKTIPYLASGLGACYVGMARAAFEYAFKYAHERISWGQPIVNHQAVALKLAEMAAEVEAARLMVWRLACAADEQDPRGAGMLSPAAKTIAVDVAIRNAERAVKILGGYGLAEEYDTSHFLTDAWVGESCDGTRDMLLLGLINFLRTERGLLQMGPPGADRPPEAAHRSRAGGPPGGMPPG
ncbi:MAG: acyl-CoA/acyl-ACP dehydrogenase [Halioglobus sp.]|nr:acyl-CoA/acyl-ACP dehydrogenase [Halioglobus sp.]